MNTTQTSKELQDLLAAFTKVSQQVKETVLPLYKQANRNPITFGEFVDEVEKGPESKHAKAFRRVGELGLCSVLWSFETDITYLLEWSLEVASNQHTEESLKSALLSLVENLRRVELQVFELLDNAACPIPSRVVGS